MICEKNSKCLRFKDNKVYPIKLRYDIYLIDTQPELMRHPSPCSQLAHSSILLHFTH